MNGDVEMGIKYNKIDDILEVANKATGKRVKDFIIEEDAVSHTSKGNIGHIIEEGLFSLKISNKQAPDFEEVGVELKVTGYKWVYRGTKVSAKERLVITMIDYFNDINKEFYKSHLYQKIEKILLMLYEYDEASYYQDFLFTHNYLYEFDKISEKDRIIILKDWEKIINKIKEGKAHELSEGDTMYLGAAPKGANRMSQVSQPFSDEKAMARAYTLKTTYMTYLLRNKVFHEVVSKESLIKDLNLIKNYSIEEIIEQMFSPYVDRTLTEIDEMIGESLNRKNNKQLMRSYTSRMLSIAESNYDHIEEFEKANIEIKTITLEANGNLKESMSFPTMDFIKVANEEWETSELKEFFETTKFLFVVYQKIEDSPKERVFKGSFLWNMPVYDIDTYIKKVWTDMNEVLNNAIEIKVKNNRVYNNFPKQAENKVSHVRPHASLRTTTKPLPKRTQIEEAENDGSVELSIYYDDHRYTAMCFWLNRTYILELIEKSDIL